MHANNAISYRAPYFHLKLSQFLASVALIFLFLDCRCKRCPIMNFSFFKSLSSILTSRGHYESNISIDFVVLITIKYSTQEMIKYPKSIRQNDWLLPQHLHETKSDGNEEGSAYSPRHLSSSRTLLSDRGTFSFWAISIAKVVTGKTTQLEMVRHYPIVIEKNHAYICTNVTVVLSVCHIKSNRF